MVWPAIGALGTAFLGYKSAQSQAQQQAAQNALLKEQYEQQKLERAPIVTGAKDQLSAGRWIDPNTCLLYTSSSPRDS